MKVKHWNTDTKLTLVMRELDIQDAMETARRYNDNHSIVFLMSSEPSASGNIFHNLYTFLLMYHNHKVFAYLKIDTFQQIWCA